MVLVEELGQIEAGVVANQLERKAKTGRSKKFNKFKNKEKEDRWGEVK